jgi:hypothetical protein
MNYTIDKLIETCKTTKNHRARLAARINRENFGVIKYVPGRKLELQLTKESYDYWVRKLDANKTIDPNSVGEIYCFLLKSFQIHKNEIMRIVKVGRCSNFENRKKQYNGPLAIQSVIGHTPVSNMRFSEKLLIHTMKDEFELLGNREEYFLVPTDSIQKLTTLFNSI